MFQVFLGLLSMVVESPALGGLVSGGSDGELTQLNVHASRLGGFGDYGGQNIYVRI